MKHKDLFKYIGISLPLVVLAGLGAAFFFKLAPVLVLGGIIAIAFAVIIFKNPVWGAYLVIFFLPFERIGSFELAGITIRASQIFALITIISWLIQFFVTKKGMAAKNPTIIPIFLFLGFCVLSLVNAINISRGLIVLGFIAFVMIMSLMIPNLVRSKKVIKIILQVLFITTLLVCVFGIYQFLGDMAGLSHEITGLSEHYTQRVFGFPRVQSTALEPLYFANFLLIPVSLLLALLLFRKKGEEIKDLPLKPIWMFLILILAVFNIILTISRGGYLALAGVAILTALIYFRRIFSFKILISLLILIAVTLAGTYSFLIVTGKSENIETFFEHVTSYEEGAGVVERYTTYEDAIDMVWRHPVLGVGIGNFGPQVAQIPWQTPKDGWAIVNNEFLEIWAETGILGLFSFLAIIVILVLRSIKAFIMAEDKFLKTVLVGFYIASFGVIIQYQTFSILYILHVWMLIGLMVAVQNLLLEKEAR